MTAFFSHGASAAEQMTPDIFRQMPKPVKTEAVRLMADLGVPVSTMLRCTGESRQKLFAIGSLTYQLRLGDELSEAEATERAAVSFSAGTPRKNPPRNASLPQNPTRVLLWIHGCGGTVKASLRTIEKEARLGYCAAGRAMDALLDFGFVERVAMPIAKEPTVWALTQRGRDFADHLAQPGGDGNG